MRIAVVGAGGVGGYFGGKLAKAGIDTTFIVRGRTLEALRSRGLRVDSIGGDFHLEQVNATDSPTEKVDAVLLTVKAWQLPEAAANLRPILHEDTIVVPLQNGIDAPEVLAPLVGQQHVAGGLCAIVSFVVEPGHIRHAGADPFLMFGELDNRTSDRATRLLAAMHQAGLTAEIPQDIHRSMWTKFVFITPMSGVGAATRVPLGVWRSMPEPRALAERMIREVVAVANARGVALADEVVAQTMQRYDMLQAESTASLQRDVMEGKPSELEAQLGAVVRLGREAGVPTPVTEVLYHALLPQERAARAI
ncbi:MAG TPA: 2-dehydropantoate 2-reductase [Thermoanaerobaculia bacterium]